MSMPLMVWVMEPPRPCQNVFWCSFSLTRSGSARSRRVERRSTASAADQRVAGEHAAPPGEALVGQDGDERVDAVVGPQFVGPAALGRAAPEAEGADLADLHT